MLLRRFSHPNVHRHTPLRYHRHLAAAAAPDSDELALNRSDLCIAKILSTVFLLADSPDAAAARLAPLRHTVTSSSAFEAVRRLSNHNPLSALHLLDLTKSRFEIHHSAAVYRFLVTVHCRSGFHDTALKVFDQMLADGHSVNESFLHSFVESCTESGQVNASMRLIASAAELGCTIQSYAFNKLMSQLVARNRAVDAICFFREQRGSRFLVTDTCSFNIAIKGLCRSGGDIDQAFELLREMDAFGCPPDSVTYNILVDGLCKANQVDRASETLRRMQSDGGRCLPNVVTYTSVICGYCKRGKMEEAWGVFGEMIGCGVKPSKVTYNVLIDGYGKAGDMSSALSLYEKMMIAGCLPDVVTFTSLIDGYCRRGQLDDAMKLWRQMGEKDLWPNAYTFSIVIIALTKKNRFDEARALLKELNARNDILPRAFIYNPVIDAFCKAGNVDEANSILSEMMGKRCSPDKFTYTILIIGHCMKGRMFDAIALFDRMLTTGCSPDDITVSSLISCLLKAGMPNEAKQIMLFASEKDASLDTTSLRRNALMSPCVPS